MYANLSSNSHTARGGGSDLARATATATQSQRFSDSEPLLGRNLLDGGTERIASGLLLDSIALVALAVHQPPGDLRIRQIEDKSRSSSDRAGTAKL